MSVYWIKIIFFSLQKSMVLMKTNIVFLYFSPVTFWQDLWWFEVVLGLEPMPTWQDARPVSTGTIFSTSGCSAIFSPYHSIILNFFVEKFYHVFVNAVTSTIISKGSRCNNKDSVNKKGRCRNGDLIV